MLISPASLRYLAVTQIQRSNLSIKQLDPDCRALITSLRSRLYLIYIHSTYFNEVIINEWVISLEQITSIWGPFGKEHKFVSLPDFIPVTNGWIHLKFVITSTDEIDLSCTQAGRLIERDFRLHHRSRL
jgi:hypothetical protein